MKLKTIFASLLIVICANMAMGSTTLPIKGNIIPASDPNIQYVGRISFKNPESPLFTYPGVQINARFEGTSLRLHFKPESGYFMVSIDGCEAFKVGFTAKEDSVATVAVALPHGVHEVRIMNAIESYQRRSEFRGFILDEGCHLAAPPALPERSIEFIGNSITCGYGVESVNENDHFNDATENHYLTYAAQTARNLKAVEYVVARSGIGVYRNFDGPREGSPVVMPKQYEYTNFDDFSEPWDFSRYTPDVVCINLGTNDTSTNNYDSDRLLKAYRQFLSQVRGHHPKAKIVLLCGSMLQGKELELVRHHLDTVCEEAHQRGDKEVYRFDFTPQNGDLKYGADWHPSLWQHQKMAGELTAFLRVLMGWF